RTAGRARDVARIAGLADVQVGELSRHGLAKQDAAGLATEGDAGRVTTGAPALMDWGPPLGRQVGRIDDVLNAERDAAEWPGAADAVEGPGSGDCLLGIHMRPRADVGLALGDAIETGTHHRFAGDTPGIDLADDLRRRQFIGSEFRLHDNRQSFL